MNLRVVCPIWRAETVTVRQRTRQARPQVRGAWTSGRTLVGDVHDPARRPARRLDPERDGAARTYLVKTLGCQMNVHDSEHMAGMLEQAGYVAASPVQAAAEDADVIVINTCAVRENAADKLYGNLGRLAASKRARPGMQIAVGGCLAQKDRAGIVERAPWVDVVFGTHNLDVLPVLLERARHNAAAQVEIEESLKVFPSTLPTRRESVYAGWVSISVGCNNTCTFCIVPHLRGKERDRRPGEILAEVEALVSQGAIEVTLLGQNVNSYGVEFGDRGAFARLLRAAGAIEGLERVRFTSPHPAAFTDDVIEAMAADPDRHAAAAHAAAVGLRPHPAGHAPLVPVGQVPRHPRPRAGRDAGRGDHHRHHRRLPGGDRGGLRRDPARRRGVPVRLRLHVPVLAAPGHARRSTCTDEVPKAVVQERFLRLTALQDRIAHEENLAQVGPDRRGAGRRGGGSQGRRHAPRHRTRRRQPPGAPGPAGRRRPTCPVPGDLVSVTVTHAAPYHLVADSALTGGTFAVRRTAAGDAWDRRQNGQDEHSHGGAGDSCGTGGPAGPVVLGLPTIGLARR